MGFALANSIIFIVDVTENLEGAAEIYEAFRTITTKPITDIIYTHNHADHVNGAQVWGWHPLFGTQYLGGLDGTQYANGRYAVRKNPVISDADINFYFKKVQFPLRHTLNVTYKVK